MRAAIKKRSQFQSKEIISESQISHVSKNLIERLKYSLTNSDKGRHARNSVEIS